MDDKSERLTELIIELLKSENCTVREAKSILDHISWVIEDTSSV